MLPLASAWDSTVDFKVLFLFYTFLLIRWTLKEITQHQALVSRIFNKQKLQLLEIQEAVIFVYYIFCFFRVRIIPTGKTTKLKRYGGLCSLGLLCCFCWQVVTEVSGQYDFMQCFHCIAPRCFCLLYLSNGSRRARSITFLHFTFSVSERVLFVRCVTLLLYVTQMFFVYDGSLCFRFASILFRCVFSQCFGCVT
jgi:hypothetical protein